MARMILSLVLLVLVTNVLSTPLTRVARAPSPDHGGEHHDHDHDHEHHDSKALGGQQAPLPTSTSSSRKSRDTAQEEKQRTGDHIHEPDHGHDHNHEHDHGSQVKAPADKSRTSRDTTQVSKEKEPEHPAALNKQDEEPVHQKLSESSLETLVGGRRVVRDDKTAKQPTVPKNAPGPFLVRGEPIEILLPTDSSPTPVPHAQQTSAKSRRRRCSPNEERQKREDKPLTTAENPSDPKNSNKENSTNSEGPRPTQRQKRDTSKPGAPGSPPSPDHGKTNDGRDASIGLSPATTPKSSSQHKRDASGGAPVSPPSPVYVKTEDGRDAKIVLPPIPGGPKPQEVRQKRQINPQHKADEKGNENPATLKHDHEEKEGKVETKKQKRDTYSDAHKESKDASSGTTHSHEQPETSIILTPPTHISEYNRHVRQTNTGLKGASPDSKPISAVHKTDDDDDDDDDDDSSEEKHKL